MANSATVTVLGRAGSEVEVKFLPSGKAVANLSLACTPSKKTEDGWEDLDTLWFQVSTFSYVDSLVETVEKGDLITVTGRLSIRSYTNKSGEEKTVMNIDAQSVALVQKNRKDKPTTEAAPF